MKGKWRLFAGLIFVVGALAVMVGAAAVVDASIPRAAPATAQGNETIESITATCGAGVVNGTLTVASPVAGDTVTLGLFFHKPSDSTFTYTGNHTTVTM